MVARGFYMTNLILSVNGILTGIHSTGKYYELNTTMETLKNMFTIEVESDRRFTVSPIILWDNYMAGNGELLNDYS